MRPVLFAIAVWLVASSVKASDLVIVMDDLGYSLTRAEQVLALPAPVTLALLPFAPDTAAIVARAQASGHEIILHQPMEPLPRVLTASPPHHGHERGTLTVSMSAQHFEESLDAALKAVPGVVGINNHTGSLLTQDRAAMGRLMRYLNGRGLLFLDSRTTAATVAFSMAQEARVPALERDVFLDHRPDLDSMTREFQRAVDTARQQGHAIVIAHPYPQSIEFLRRALAGLPPDLGLISLQQLSQRLRPAMFAQHENPASPHKSLGQ